MKKEINQIEKDKIEPRNVHRDNALYSLGNDLVLSIMAYKYPLNSVLQQVNKYNKVIH